MLKSYSITPLVLAILTIGFLLPLGAGMLITFSVERDRQHQELIEFQDQALEALARSTIDSLAVFSPAAAFNSASMLLNDGRVVRIEVYSSVYGMFLVNLPLKSAREVMEPRTVRKILSQDGETLGYVALTIDLGWIDPLIARERLHALGLFSTIFVVAMLLIIPTIYFKILRPLRRLISQARRISAGDLQSPLTWTGKDELSVLGRTLDHMREELRESFGRVQKLARTDDLTGIANRRAFMDKLGQLVEMSRRYQTKLTLAILDLDHFKRINDKYGHTTGDDVLVEFARVVSRRIRGSDVFARFGGEEFILCLPETGRDQAHTLLEELRQAVAGYLFPHGELLTVSIGFTPYVPPESLEETITRADKALYLAKSKNRNRTEVLDVVEG